MVMKCRWSRLKEEKITSGWNFAKEYFRQTPRRDYLHLCTRYLFVLTTSSSVLREPLLSSGCATGSCLTSSSTLVVVVQNDGDGLSSSISTVRSASTIASYQQESIGWISSEATPFARAIGRSTRTGCGKAAQSTRTVHKGASRLEGEGKAQGREGGSEGGIPCQIHQSVPVVDVLFRHDRCGEGCISSSSRTA